MSKKYWQFVVILGWVNIGISIVGLTPWLFDEVSSKLVLLLSVVELLLGGIFVTFGRMQLQQRTNK